MEGLQPHHGPRRVLGLETRLVCSLLVNKYDRLIREGQPVNSDSEFLRRVWLVGLEVNVRTYGIFLSGNR